MFRVADLCLGLNFYIALSRKARRDRVTVSIAPGLQQRRPGKRPAFLPQFAPDWKSVLPSTPGDTSGTGDIDTVR
ncbi:MAG: hypothetical protein JO108_00310 [Acidobacteriaceae bacterium]|nr:hypothetical protein [Acidobacteriaceae bacterium]